LNTHSAKVVHLKYDKIIVATKSLKVCLNVGYYLQSLGIPKYKMEYLINHIDEEKDIRCVFTRNFANFAYIKDMKGSND